MRSRTRVSARSASAPQSSGELETYLDELLKESGSRLPKSVKKLPRMERIEAKLEILESRIAPIYEGLTIAKGVYKDLTELRDEAEVEFRSVEDDGERVE